MIAEINSSTVMKKLRDLIGDSTVLSEYCTSKFEKAHQVFLGYIPEDPPTIEQFPCFMISRPQKSWQGKEVSIRVPVGTFIQSDKITTTGNKITHEAVLDAEDLKELMETEVIKTLGRVSIVTSDMHEVENLFPGRLSITTFEFKGIISQRGRK